MDIISKQTGDSLSASEFNQIPNELENLITSAGFNPSESNLMQVAESVAQITADGRYFETSGSANAIILTQKENRKPVKQLTDGVQGVFKAGSTNTDIATINLCNLGAKGVTKNGVALKAGDIKANVLYNFIYDGTTDTFAIADYFVETDPTLSSITNRLYDGVNLVEKFAEEIANYSDEWQWIRARIQAGNYEGLLVGDYIPVTVNGGTAGGKAVAQQTVRCQIAGIDTYKNCGDTEIGHHIDFISQEVIDTEITWNPQNNNNGTSPHNEPWLASQVYAWLNGLNNYTTSAYQNVPHGMNALNAGIYQLLPTKLRNVMIQKRNLLDTRYSSSALLTYSGGWGWQDMGYLWLPNEMEVYGTQVRSNLGYGQGYWNPEANVGVAYPIFLGQGRNRVKRTSNGSRSAWWLSSASSLNSASVCLVYSGGDASHSHATLAGVRCPLCFRVG